MGNNGIFARLSVEDHTDATQVEDNIVADIEAQEAMDDAYEIAMEAQADVAAMQQAEVAADRIEAQIAHEEAMLEKPETVTATTVVLAQESLAATAMMLGADESMITGYKVSHEAAESNPVSSLTVSHEGAKDFLKKVYASIKLIFKKIVNAIKKLVVKLVVAMNGVEKAAKKLKESHKKSKLTKPGKTNFDEKKSKAVNMKFAAYIVREKGSDGNLDDSVITKYIGAYEKNGQLSQNMAAAVTFLTNDLATVINSTDENDAVSNYANLIKKFGGAKFNNQDVFGYSEITDKHATIYIGVISTNKQKFVEITMEKLEGSDLSDKEKCMEALKSLSFKVVSVTVGKDDIGDKAPVATDITGLCDKIITFAKGLKPYSDTRLKEIAELEKEIDKMAKDSDGNSYINKLKNNVYNGSRAVVTGLYLDGVLARATVSKALLSYAKDSFAEYKKDSI